MSHAPHGRPVRFVISDACVPEPAEILALLHGQDFLEGKVTDLTDSGDEVGAYAVVDVPVLARPVVVPTRCLQDKVEDHE